MKFLKGHFPENIVEEGRSNAKGCFHPSTSYSVTGIEVVEIS
jgi:hypothetical protein